MKRQGQKSTDEQYAPQYDTKTQRKQPWSLPPSSPSVIYFATQSYQDLSPRFTV